jgi:hypothetical protein
MPDSVGTGPTLTSFTSPEPSGLDIPIVITKFPTAAASDRTEHRLRLRAILPALRDTRAAAKAALPWLKLASFGDQRTDRGSLRSDRNLLTIHGVEGDYDGEQITLDRARRVLEQAGLAAILYTSPSHTPQAPRWRVLCPTSVSLPPADRARLLARLNGLFVGALSRESWTLSQSYYYGAVGEAPHHAVIAIDGRPIDMAADLDAGAISKPGPPKPDPVAYTYQPQTLGDGIASPYARRALENECHAIASAPDGGKHHALNKAAYSIGGLVSAGEIDEGYAFGSLSDALSAIRSRCEDFAAAERTLRQGFEDGKAARRTVPEAAPAFDPTGLGIFQQRAVAGQPDNKSVELVSGTADAPSPDVFHTFGIEDIISMPAPVWLVQGVITTDGVGGIYGPPGSLKSFLALGMALSVAYGMPWLGRPTAQTGVLYVAAEGVRGMGKRIRAWQRKHKLEKVDAPFRLLAATVNLTDTAQTAKLIRTAIAAASLEGCHIGLVIIDTVARAMAGADENSAQDMGRFIGGCDAIKQEVKCAVLGIHHSGKDKERGARGSSAFLGAMDMLARVERSETGTTVTLTIEKQKDDEEGDPISLGVEKIDITTGLKPENSLVLTLPVSGPEPERPDEREARLMLLALCANALGPDGVLTINRLAEAIGTPGGRAREAIKAAIPLAPDCAEVTSIDGICRLWRARQGEGATAAFIVRRKDM